MTPKVYLYKETEKGYELYVGEYSTHSGLLLFARATSIRVVKFGAAQYKQHGWVTEKEIPHLGTVGDTIDFLISEEQIGLIDFTAEISGFGELSTHDDGECHFVMSSRQQCLKLMKDTIVPQYRDVLINKLLENHGVYISCSSVGEIVQYQTFDDYLRNK